jgi:Cu/Ag efflux pump CusA
MKPIAASMPGGMITSSIQVLIRVPILFLLWRKQALQRGMLYSTEASSHDK